MEIARTRNSAGRGPSCKQLMRSWNSIQAAAGSATAVASRDSGLLGCSKADCCLESFAGYLQSAATT